MNIVQLFLDAAGRNPQKPAIIDSKGEISFGQLAEEVRDTAAHFERQGLKSGDRVLVFIPMGIDLYRVVLALFYLGATAVFLDEWSSMDRLKVACRLADCKGFIGTWKSRLLGFFIKDIRQIPLKLKLEGAGTNSQFEVKQVSKEHTALITFTTGSTGIPKAADRSHGFLAQQFKALSKEIQPLETDIDMPVLPIVLFLNLGIGSTSVIADFNGRKPESFNGEKISQQLLRHKVNRIIASPYFVRRLAEYQNNSAGTLPQLKKIYTGGAPVFPSEAALYQEALPEQEIHIVYGSTEAEPISSISMSDLLAQASDLPLGLAVGQVFEDTDLRILPIKQEALGPYSIEEFESLSLTGPQLGEIVVSGDHVLSRYYKNPQAFKENKIEVEGKVWHRTGDSGRLIKEQLFLSGRCQQLIWDGLQYHSNFVIENQLLQIPEIALGTLMDLGGELVLVVETMLKLEDLSPRLQDFQFDRIAILKRIPRDPRHNSKIDYGKLKQILTS